jgi:hypothetical protein
MIEMPRRSVTRFFIPLIDVLTLLFCIFLIMPLVKARDDGAGSEAGPASELERLQRENRALRSRLEERRKEMAEELQRTVAVCVLEIDADTGKLHAYDRGHGSEHWEVTGENVRRLIDQETAAARGKTVYFVFLYPRPASGNPTFPLRRQREEYDRWFDGVPHGYDLPARTP